METWLTAHETAVRLFAFVSILVAMMVWEFAAPRRPLSLDRSSRWMANLLLAVGNSAIIRLIFPILAVGMAEIAATNGWGLLNAQPLSAWITVPVSLLVLDCLIYGQHVMFHAVSPLWRLHMMHHSDLDFDTTTGVRFHPIEIIISMIIKIAAVLALGAPPEAVIVFEILLNGTSLFNHGNVRLPSGVDRALRLLIVTPDMHRVHHSIHPYETNSNFGFNFPWWDRLFGTYRPQPEDGHAGMTIGLTQFRKPDRLELQHLLLMPFVSGTGTYPMLGQARKSRESSKS